LYIADNLAWFPHATLEEVLFIIKIADTKINGSGNDILHTFRKEMAKTDGSMSDDAMETESRKSADDSDSDVDPDDEDAIERLRHRLPPAPQIQNFLKRSLAIFMLLRLRIYLKQAYNLSDKRIDSYANNDSVSDSTKSKPAMRRTGPCFEPPEVLAYLEGSYRDGESEKTRREAIKIYFRLKQLMYEIDDIDDSSDEEGNKKEHKLPKKGITAQLEAEAKEMQKIQQKKEELDSDRDTDGEEKKADILDRARKSIHKKKQKEKKKKKRRRVIDAGSDSSGSDFNPYA